MIYVHNIDKSGNDESRQRHFIMPLFALIIQSFITIYYNDSCT